MNVQITLRVALTATRPTLSDAYLKVILCRWDASLPPCGSVVLYTDLELLTNFLVALRETAGLS